MLGVGAKKKTYMDDVFSTYIYDGNSSTNAINNGINLSGEGGLVWAKTRNGPYNYNLYDTVRGTAQPIYTSSPNAASNQANGMNSFNSDGFTLGSDANLNESNKNYSSWTFRKASGFFDVVTWTGNGSTRTIAHSLGSTPGMILVKNTSNTSHIHWTVWHRGNVEGNADYTLILNDNSANAGNNTYFDNGSTPPTSTNFTVHTSNRVNADGDEYVAYVFAGGESTAATARSVEFDGSGDYLSLASGSSSSLRPGTGDFCIEAWLNPDSFSNERGHYMTDNGGILFQSDGTNYIFKKHGGSALLTGPGLEIGQWTHVAVTRSGTSLKMFYNGTEVDSATDSTDITGTAVTYIGSTVAYWDGKISNLRLVIGSAVYTSSFRPLTEPLTNITNTVLLCCNDSSTTGSTVTPGTITATSSPTASTDSGFDDPAGFVFGENEDQNVIKCGSYIGNGSSTGPEVDLGWEPQWVMIKRIDTSENWFLWDSMRGIPTGGDDARLIVNSAAAEVGSTDRIDLTSRGFKIPTTSAETNASGGKYIYMCLRRPDGYVGKPADAGTDVFAMDYGSGSTAIPEFDSGFPVDFATYRVPTTADHWYSGVRLNGAKYFKLNEADAEGSDADTVWDSNVGWQKAQSSSRLSFMWKRHTGFDVLTYIGNGVGGRRIPHSLNRAPEMVWIKLKNRDNHGWVVGHIGLNGGTNPWTRYLTLDTDGAEATQDWPFDDTAPTANNLILGNGGRSNGDQDPFIAMLFASVDGISKVGYYAGSDSEQTITTGFQPRFVIIKNINLSENWFVLDTTRGWGSGDDKWLALNTNGAQNPHGFGTPTSTGFTMPGDDGSFNDAGNNFIYYAHA